MGGEKAPDLLLAGALGNRPLSGVVVMEIKSTEPSRTVLKTGRWAPSQAQTAPISALLGSHCSSPWGLC